MFNFREYTQNYINWVLRLGKTKSAILGFTVLATSAIIIQCLLSLVFTGHIRLNDIWRSIIFGLISAPFALYFFNLIVERLERSRIKLEQSLYDLSFYKEIIEKNNRDKTKLMATISHELRTPLNGIIGLSRILLEGELQKQQKEYLETINISAISLGHIFSDIIDLEKIDSKRIDIHRDNIAFSQIISNISHFANILAEQKQIKFHLNYDKNLPEFILVDNARLSQILWNLVNNAVKFTPEKGDIYLDIHRIDQNHFSFSLKDTGIGIPKKEQQHIFEMFYQAENNGEKAKGSGIGLAISKTIAQLMGGDLTVNSDVNQGAVFTLNIEAEESLEKQTPSVQDHHLKVLLVEDIEVNIVVAKAVLAKFGCEVDVAMSGAESYPLIEKNHYDLILLDIQLPDTTGFEIAQTLINRYENDKMDYLPILVALTANVMHTKEEYKQKGMDDVIRKPLSVEELASCLNNFFGDEFLQKDPQIAPLAEPKKALKSDKNLPFNTQVLQELIDVMGKTAVLNNFKLFAELMPDYMKNLTHYHQQWKETQTPEMRKLTAEEAHKIKGAFSSVGLSRLQEVAQLAQTDNSVEWENSIADWILVMGNDWEQDLNIAQKWIENI